MTMTVRIVTDSSCDLPQSVADTWDIEIVPLSISFGDAEFIDRQTITGEEFWKKCAESPVLPQTAAPSPGAFKTAYEKVAGPGVTDIVVISLSGELSATFQNAQHGAKEYSGSATVHVIDSRTATMGLGLLVMEAAAMARGGAMAADIVDRVNSMVPRVRVFGALDTLENLKKGGRIGGAKALLANALSIKPIVAVQNGLVEEAGKQRTRSKALAFLVEKLTENDGNIERLAILHAQCTDVDQFLSMVKAAYPHEVTVGDIGAVIGTHAGEGTIGVAFIVAK